ncbi:MAG: ribonuclease D [Pseudomonadota bacterium]
MTVIVNQDDLDQLCAGLARTDTVAIDTEFIREKTYWPRICLIQVAAQGHEAVIDALASLDLTPLWKVTANKKITKVLHAAQQDLEIFYQHMGKRKPQNIKDTQIMAMALGYGEAPSYAYLIESLFGKQLDKSSRLSNWAQRPLSESQINYALQDVRYLLPAYKELNNKLKANKREHWTEHEYEVMLNPDRYRPNPKQAWQRIKGARRNVKHLTTLQGMAQWREEVAMKSNIPIQWVMRDEVLKQIANERPTNKKDLGQVRGIASGSVRHYGDKILRIISDSVQKKPPPPEPKKLIANRYTQVADIMKLLLRQRAAEHKVATKLIATSAEVDLIVTHGDIDTPALKGWRRDVFGKDALALLRGDIAVRVGPDRTLVFQNQPMTS